MLVTDPAQYCLTLYTVFDSSLNFRKHLSQTCRSCFYRITDLRRNRKSLSLDLAVALASSKLEYCNSELPCKSGNLSEGSKFRSLRSYSKTITLAYSQVSHSF